MSFTRRSHAVDPQNQKYAAELELECRQCKALHMFLNEQLLIRQKLLSGVHEDE